MSFPSVLVQALHINITWLLIQCQNPFTSQIPTLEKSTKQNLSLKQRIWPKMQMWWLEQGISAFHLTRVTVEMVERHPRHLSTVQEVRAYLKYLVLVISHLLLLFNNPDTTGCTKLDMR